MSGLLGPEGTQVLATWVAALLTLVVLGGMLGERRLFGWSQHLLAGLATGFLALLAISEVIVPRLLEPLAVAPIERGELWLGVALVAVTAGAPWLPRAVSAVPLSVAIGAVAAFALGGAVVGTLIPQLGVAVAGPQPTLAAMLGGVAIAIVTALVLIGFLHGVPRGRFLGAAASTGRWLMLVGLGGWLGYLLFSRLVLLVDRVGFLVGDWLGLVP